MKNLKSKRNSLGHYSWKSYNSIKKKAMEHEFSWSGLTVCLSIAFFISISSAQVLKLTYQSIVHKEVSQTTVYKLEVRDLPRLLSAQLLYC